MEMISCADTLGYCNVEINTSVTYTRRSLRFHWVSVKEEERVSVSGMGDSSVLSPPKDEEEEQIGGMRVRSRSKGSGEREMASKTRTKIVITEKYRHLLTGEETLIPPLYTPEENFGAKKFQSAWSTYKV